MPKVYVVQEVLKHDPSSNTLVPVHDFSIAGQYGEIEVLFPDGPLPVVPSTTIHAIKKKLSNFSDEDYILNVGDPALISLVAGIVSRQNHGRYKVLRWNRKSSSYTVWKIEL